MSSFWAHANQFMPQCVRFALSVVSVLSGFAGLAAHVCSPIRFRHEAMFSVSDQHPSKAGAAVALRGKRLDQLNSVRQSLSGHGLPLDRPLPDLRQSLLFARAQTDGTPRPLLVSLKQGELRSQALAVSERSKGLDKVGNDLKESDSRRRAEPSSLDKDVCARR